MNDGSVGLVVEGLLKVRELHRSYNNEAAVKSLNQAYQIQAALAEKIGGDSPAGSVFERREIIGTVAELPEAPIAHRILWLDGLEPGLNQGGDVDTHARYVYIHGVGDESTIGQPASRGCIHLAAADLLPFYDRTPSGTLLWIAQGAFV